MSDRKINHRPNKRQQVYNLRSITHEVILPSFEYSYIFSVWINSNIRIRISLVWSQSYYGKYQIDM